MCLSRCNCHLRIRYDRPTSIPLDVKPASKSVAKALGVLAIAKAIQQTAKGGDKAKVKVADLEPDLEPDLDDLDLESVKVLDWNKLDEMVSALATLRILEEKVPPAHRVKETSIALDKFEKASKGLPNWLDPFSREVYVWHAIGTVVLDYIKEARKRGEI